jgi:hypothetical protein
MKMKRVFGGEVEQTTETNSYSYTGCRNSLCRTVGVQSALELRPLPLLGLLKLKLHYARRLAFRGSPSLAGAFGLTVLLTNCWVLAQVVVTWTLWRVTTFL